MQSGAMKTRLWKLISRIFNGRKSVGVDASSCRADPGGGDVFGMKKGAAGLDLLIGAAMMKLRTLEVLGNIRWSLGRDEAGSRRKQRLQLQRNEFFTLTLYRDDVYKASIGVMLKELLESLRAT